MFPETAVRRGEGPRMHSNLTLISRHPPCGKQSCTHHNPAKSPQSRGNGGSGGSVFNARVRIPRLYLSITVPCYGAGKKVVVISKASTGECYGTGACRALVAAAAAAVAATAVVAV